MMYWNKLKNFRSFSLLGKSFVLTTTFLLLLQIFLFSCSVYSNENVLAQLLYLIINFACFNITMYNVLSSESYISKE